MKLRYLLTVIAVLVFVSLTHAQMITGVWKGKVGNGLKPAKLELKLIQRGDSLFGTSYYYESPNNYRRYAVKGYFNTQTNEVVWWDDELIEAKTGRIAITSPGAVPLLMEADFNCPGGAVMMLDGKAVTKEEQKNKGDLHLDKVEQPQFTDEWNFVIDNYTVGANDPYFIDSVAAIHKVGKQPEIVAVAPPPVLTEQPKREEPKPDPVILQPQTTIPKETQPVTKTENKPPVKEPAVVVTKPPTITEKFIERKKVLTTELPLLGDTVEIHFYDNAEIDGDSISLFMNNRLVFEHVKLSDKPYVVKFAVKELTENNELVMVAENLGAIPPNTSYMIAYVNGVRYTANLESTENSSAMIRFVRKE
ncbi:hypothetical protein ESA94_13190 [Lacibacter luteus]|uniref:Uncharacterized protein n=1 Tax=Lacibacter luteus TaxID=2508719 RepID=A0A4Q1CI06_9BACT|nr:hypothetical protein [Lacibacter luteus]RXK59997.1 hypothetical protein ESA94_13190 [Lacibacter luteus]